MHHMMDLPVSEVAHHLDVPEGTVKSWLHRGRTALAEELRLDVRAAIVTPPLERVQKSSLVPRGVVALALTLVLIGVGYAVVRAVRGAASPVVPAVSPSPSPSAGDPMAAVDWTHATINFDLAAEGCVRGELRFEPTEAGRAIANLSGDRPMVVTTSYPPAIGDLDGDGRAEAVLGVYCMPFPGDRPQAERLMVVSRSADGVLNAVAITSYRPKLTRSLRIEDSGTIVANVRSFPEVPGEVETQERWRLTRERSLEQMKLAF